jgi:hypothetical protein
MISQKTLLEKYGTPNATGGISYSYWLAISYVGLLVQKLKNIMS